MKKTAKGGKTAKNVSKRRRGTKKFMDEFIDDGKMVDDDNFVNDDEVEDEDDGGQQDFPAFLREENIKDLNGKKIGEEGYDDTTIYVPKNDY